MNSKSHADPVERTLAYYDAHAEEFIGRTAAVSMDDVYAPFLALIPPGGRILDAGCGSARDAQEFARRGYAVTAFDGSEEMARRASDRTGMNVLHLRFGEIEWRGEFDGIWACASLLHLPSDELPAALTRIVQALKPGGALFVSMKLGEFEGDREGRWFTDITPNGLRRVMEGTKDLEGIGVWQTADARPERASTWVNVLARRSNRTVPLA